jgi:hypothetical protein
MRAGGTVQRKLLWPAAIAVGLGVLLLATWWLYDAGKLRGAIELESLRTEHSILKKRHARALRENRKLRDQVAILERSSQIDRQASLDVKADLGELEQALQASREEIEFYRGIIAPGDVKSGLRIHRFSLESGTAAREYRYELVLAQLKRNEHHVSGVVDWKISGQILGEPAELELADVTRPALQQLKFRFRYFQNLTGSLTLPDDFEPDKVTLHIRPEGKGKPEPVVQVLDWPATDS